MKGEMVSDCHGYWVYQLPNVLFIDEIEFGTKERADQIINGWWCSKCNKICNPIKKKEA